MLYKKVIFACLTILLVPLVLSAFELEPVSVQTTTATATGSNNYNNAKNTYQTANNDYQTARTSYLNAKSVYLKAKTDENLDLALAAARDYLTKALDTSSKYLSTLKAQVESLTDIDEQTKTNILNELNTDISWLEAKKTEVAAAQDKDTLISVAETIKSYWDDTKVKIKKNVGQVLAAKTSKVIASLEAAGTAVQEKINQLKENGQDVSDLETLLSKYNEHVVNAKADWELAKNKFNEITTLQDADALFKEGKDYLEAAHRDARYAYNQLQDIRTELEKKKLYKVDLGGTGSLHAEGKGIAELDGKGSVIASTDALGTVTVVDREGDSKIETEGSGEAKTIDDQTKQYSGYGKITVNGTDINVKVQGSELTMDAAGTGTASMTGEGTYYIGPDGVPKAIPAGGIKVNLTGTATDTTSTTDSTNQ